MKRGGGVYGLPHQAFLIVFEPNQLMMISIILSLYDVAVTFRSLGGTQRQSEAPTVFYQESKCDLVGFEMEFVGIWGETGW